MTLARTLTAVAAGVAVGLGGAALLTRSLESMLFGLSATDPITFVVVPVAFASVAALAALVPSRRAIRLDPQIALRCD